VVKFPEKPIEVLIALSILVSAVHAIRPLFPEREHYVAALFGLVHGLAFAGSLTGFNYDSLALILAVLGFNLGIEAMQLAIVTAVLPSLLLMRATPMYRYFRIGAALMTGALAIAWALERAIGMANPFNHISDLLIAHNLFVISALAVLAIAARAIEFVSQRRRFFAANSNSRIKLPDPFNP